MKSKNLSNKKIHSRGYLPMTADLFHVGHLFAIQKAKKQCRTLIIGLLTDAAVKKYRGQPPIIPHAQRALILNAINIPNIKVVQQESIDMSNNFKKYKPSIAFSSDGWEQEEMSAMKKYNVKAGKFSYYRKQSSTKIKNTIIQAWKDSQKDTKYSA